MKVNVLVNTNIWGGAEAHALSLLSAIRERGGSATLLCVEPETEKLFKSRIPEGVADLACRSLGKPLRRYSFFDWMRVFRSMPGDVCVYEKGTLHAGSLALELAAKISHRGFITIEQLEPPAMPPRTSRTYFGGRLSGLGLWWYRMRFKGYLRSLAPHRIIAVSDSVKRALVGQYNFSGEKIVTIRNGADPVRFRPDGEARRRFRAELGLNEGTIVFGSVRRFSRDKGLDVAIEAYRRFVGKYPECDSALVLVGEGPERGRLEAQVRDSNLEGKVTFKSFSPRPWEVYPGFDFFLLPSRNEALSLALSEAMASGCIPIATEVGGAREILSSAVLGRVVPPDDPGAFAQAMAEIALLDPSVREDAASRCRVHIIDHFNETTQMRKITNLIWSLAGNHVLELEPQSNYEHVA